MVVGGEFIYLFICLLDEFVKSILRRRPTTPSDQPTEYLCTYNYAQINNDNKILIPNL